MYKIEGGKRIPRQEYLIAADELLNAGGLIAATWEDVKKVRYPKRVRELAKLEAQAVEIGVYECNIIAGLLQTPEHARAVIGAAQPPYSPDDVERMVAARLARQSVFERDPAPALSFVLEEGGVLRRPIGGGTMAWRHQLERLLEVGRLHNVVLQVMPMLCDTHSGGLDGRIEVLKFADGTAVGRSDGAFNGRPTHDPKHLRILELRYGTIRLRRSRPPGSRWLHRETAGRDMIRKPTAGDTSELAWFKSSYSGGNDGNSCVEVAHAPGTVHVRDSKSVGGPQLALAPGRLGRLRDLRVARLIRNRSPPQAPSGQTGGPSPSPVLLAPTMQETCRVRLMWPRTQGCRSPCRTV